MVNPTVHDLGPRLEALLAQSDLPEEVRMKFAEIIIRLSRDDIMTVIDALTADPMLAEFLVRDLALKQQYRKSGDTTLISEILKNQDQAFDTLEEKHHD